MFLLDDLLGKFNVDLDIKSNTYGIIILGIILLVAAVFVSMANSGIGIAIGVIGAIALMIGVALEASKKSHRW